VTNDGTVYVGHQDMTVKKYLPIDSINGIWGCGKAVADSLPVSPRVVSAAAQQVRRSPAGSSGH